MKERYQIVNAVIQIIKILCLKRGKKQIIHKGKKDELPLVLLPVTDK